MVSIRHPAHGRAILNDQYPLNEAVLSRCLVGMTAQEWFETLNQRVFFWRDIDRTKRFLDARMGRGQKRLVLAIKTSDLLEVSDSIELSPINSGTAVRNGPLRGRETFLPLYRFPF